MIAKDQTLFYRIICVCVLACVQCQTKVDTSSPEEMIKEAGDVVNNITESLAMIEKGDYVCGSILYQVSKKMDELGEKIQDIYKGPLIANLSIPDRKTSVDSILLLLPDSVNTCIRQLRAGSVVKRQARLTCIQQMLWRYQVQRPKPKVEKQDKLVSAFVKQVEEPKRVTRPPFRAGSTLFSSSFAFFSSFTSSTSRPLRIRKEYRTLSYEERQRFHDALNVLYADGTIDAFAQTHATASQGAHRGPAFLPWHRAFITMFEDALQGVDPSVTLPYWDSTIDFCMDFPTDSVLWTPSFLGNGYGQVVTGPFAYWTTGRGFLTRAYGMRGKLISNLNVQRLLSRCRYREITANTGSRRYKLEAFHNGVHIWVGGEMSAIRTSPYDPVFFLHHCFVDYLWEKFRERQVAECNRDPETDYIDVDGSHNIDAPMMALDGLKNRDGLKNYWTETIYQYEETPTCENNCGNSYVLYCDAQKGCCVPVTASDFSATTSPPPTTSTALFSSASTASSVGSESSVSTKRPDKIAPIEPVQVRKKCDPFIDSECIFGKFEPAEVKKPYVPLPPSEQLKIIDNLIPVNRGEGFESNGDDERTLAMSAMVTERTAAVRGL